MKELQLCLLLGLFVSGCKFQSDSSDESKDQSDANMLNLAAPLPFSDATIASGVVRHQNPGLELSLVAELMTQSAIEESRPDEIKSGIWIKIGPHALSMSEKEMGESEDPKPGIESIQYTLNEEFSMFATKQNRDPDLSMEIFLDRGGFHEITAIAKGTGQQHVTASMSLFVDLAKNKLEILMLRPTRLIDDKKNEILEIEASCPGGKSSPYWHVALEERGQSPKLQVSGLKGLVVISAACQDEPANDYDPSRDDEITYLSSGSFYFKF